MLGEGKVKEAFELYVSKDFVEHSHLVRALAKTDKPGYTETLAFFNREASGQGPGGPAPKPASDAPKGGVSGLKNAQLAVVNDDMVTQYGGLGVDLFRVKEGKITDHWDASPPRSVKIIIPADDAAAGKQTTLMRRRCQPRSTRQLA